jgi:transketolase
MREAFVKSLTVAAEQNSDIFLITGDLGYGVLDKFQTKFPNQYLNTGISEQSMMGMAAGLASTGKRVFVYSIGNFPTLRCLEQIRNDVALMNTAVCVVSVGAGYSYGTQGYSHHALEDLSCMRSMPNLDVIVPSDPIETFLLTQEIASSRLPTYLRLGRSNEQVIHSNGLTEINGHLIHVEPGSMGSILVCGSIATLAIQASKILKAKGKDVGVITVPYLSRVTARALQEIASLGPMLTLEEHAVQGGFGSSILEKLSEIQLPTHFRMIGSARRDLSLVGNQEFLRKSNGLTLESIVGYFDDTLK